MSKSMVAWASQGVRGPLRGGTIPKAAYGPRPPNVPLLRALWSLLDGIRGSLKASWGVQGVGCGTSC